MLYSEKEIRESRWMTKAHNKQWYSIISRNTMGDMMYLLNKYNPQSLEDFYNKYTHDTDEDTPPRYRGRSEGEIMEIAQNYKDKCDDDTPIEDYVKNTLLHLIVETWDGYIREKQFADYAEKKGYTVRKSNTEDDAKLSIDFILSKDEKDVAMIQVKPLSYFIGNENESLKFDRKQAIIKCDKAEAKYQLPMLYVLYNHNDFERSKSGKITNRLKNLVYPDGTTKLTTIYY